VRFVPFLFYKNAGIGVMLQCKDGTGKTDLEQTLRFGMHGPPELKREEKKHFLGQFRERVLIALTFGQIAEKGTYPAVERAIRDPRARRLVISGQADLEAAREYIQLASTHNLSFTTTSSPDFQGEIGLVVVAGVAVDLAEVLVEDRAQALAQKGLPPALVEAVGEKICPSCSRLIREKAPEEATNYRRLGLMDRILGVPCLSCSPASKNPR
jgi:uncharacterized protein YueI